VGSKVNRIGSWAREVTTGMVKFEFGDDEQFCVLLVAMISNSDCVFLISTLVIALTLSSLEYNTAGPIETKKKKNIYSNMKHAQHE
jgi:hypothetical protein